MAGDQEGRPEAATDRESEQALGSNIGHMDADAVYLPTHSEKYLSTRKETQTMGERV